LQAIQRRQLLLAGIEAHICVYQTAVDLQSQGYEVQLVSDAVSARTPENRLVGLTRMQAAGVSLTSTETALFELLGVAEGDKFKKIIDIVR
jgi:nicotinamidase-related amidase